VVIYRHFDYTYSPSRILGEDKALSIKVGASAGKPLSEDVILVRGASTQVDRAVKVILQIVEDAKNGVIDENYVRWFTTCSYCVILMFSDSLPNLISIVSLSDASLAPKARVSTNFGIISVSKSTFRMKRTRKTKR
jgi:hypothetical protein